MIKALLLVISPGATWDRIVLAKRSWPVILLGYLIPLLVITGVAEGYGLVHWGKPRGQMSQITKFSNSTAVVYVILQLLLLLVIVFVGAKLVRAMGETFHGRHTFRQGFTVAAYGLGPVFALYALDMFPVISSWAYWVIWIVGVLFCMSTLYHGIPRVMLPDPPHAFGLFVISGLLLAMMTGLARFLTFWFLEGKFGKLDAFISQIVDHLPFLQSLDKVPL